MFPTQPVPERIGAYRIVRRLSAAGSADVYLGRMEGPLGFARSCALKLVPDPLAGDPRIAAELAREATICAALNHPAILRMFDFFEHGGRLVLVLEHVEGIDLARLLTHLARRQKKLGDDAIWCIGHRLAGALAHAHTASDEQGNATPILHRDVHPENVVVGWDGQVRLAGFGLGKIVGRTPDTVAGAARGRPGWMAPEQVRGERLTARADVYALGVLLWSLLTGRAPPADGRRLPPLSGERPDLARELTAAIDATLEPVVDRRRIDAAEVEAWLAKVAALDVGRDELRDKARMVRAARAPIADAPAETRPLRPSPGDARAARARPVRRVSLRNVRPSERPPGPAPLSQPRLPSTRPPPPPSHRPRPPSTWPAPGAAQERALAVPIVPAEQRSGVVPLHAPRAPSATADAALEAMLAPATPASVAPPPSQRLPAAALAGAALVTDEVAWGEDAAQARRPHAAPGLVGGVGPDAWRDVQLGAGAPPAEPPPTNVAGDDPARRGLMTRPLGAAESLAVIALSAALVVGAGAALAAFLAPSAAATPGAETSEPQRTDSVLAPVQRSPPSVTPPSATPPAAEATTTAAPSSEVAPAPTPIDAGARAGEPPSPSPPPGPDGSDLPGGYGYVTVFSEVSANVYVNGILVGSVNQPARAVCGRRFVRLGTQQDGDRFPSWVAPGQSVAIPCQSSTSVTMSPAPSPDMGRRPRSK
jgi:serine/threonine-protein kinase